MKVPLRKSKTKEIKNPKIKFEVISVSSDGVRLKLSSQIPGVDDTVYLNAGDTLTLSFDSATVTEKRAGR